MSATIKRTAMMTAILLVASAFVFAGSASAEDVNECETDSDFYYDGTVGAFYFVSGCVTDAQSGDQADCPDGNYVGETGANGEIFLALNPGGGWQAYLIVVDVDGEERCSEFGPNSEGYSASATVRDYTMGTVTADHSWDQDGISVSTWSNGQWSDDVGGPQSVDIYWGQSNGECVTVIEVLDETLVAEGCPAGGPPGAANPGWGGVTP